MRLTVGRILALLVATSALGACVADVGPGASACAAAEVTLDLELTSERLSPAPSVCRGQEVTLRIASDVDGVIHIHGYDEAVPATDVAAGETLELAFPADRAGQFPIELHPADDPEGVSVGIFTVHEP